MQGHGFLLHSPRIDSHQVLIDSIAMSPDPLQGAAEIELTIQIKVQLEAIGELLSSFYQSDVIGPARPMTHHQMMVAAWANLATEEPDLSLDEALRLLEAG